MSEHFKAGNKHMLSFIGAIVIGLLAGLVARFLMPGRDAAGLIVTILLGVAGSFVATYLGQALGWYRPDEAAGFIGAVVGAIVVLIVSRMTTGRSRT
jgi:uncharacterized membrane protein YeaQ/YmgE (transglycosylase-associated protein family)